MKTAHNYGYGYAQAMQGEEGFNSPVDINEMITSTQSIPDGDYRAMVEAGIEPDARQYWIGFNSFFKGRKK